MPQNQAAELTAIGMPCYNTTNNNAFGKAVRRMKRKTAREILADSFRELAEQMNVDRITVKAIADN